MLDGFFQDDSGNRSSMRIMCFLSLVAAIIFGSLAITQNRGRESPARDDTAILLTFSFLLGAFAPKYLQKFVETDLVKDLSKTKHAISLPAKAESANDRSDELSKLNEVLKGGF